MSSLTNQPTIAAIICPHCRQKLATQVGYYNDLTRPCITGKYAVCCSNPTCQARALASQGSYRLDLIEIDLIGKIKDDGVRTGLLELLDQLTGKGKVPVGFLHAHRSQPD